jgi:hypothetical protein
MAGARMVGETDHRLTICAVPARAFVCVVGVLRRWPGATATDGLQAPWMQCELFKFCQANSKKQGPASSNDLLREASLSLCCQHGLAADSVVGGSCLRSSVVAGEQVSPAQIQFRARHALRLSCGPGIIPAELDCFPGPQR